MIVKIKIILLKSGRQFFAVRF